MQTVAVSTPPIDEERSLLESIHARFARVVGTGKPLFTTDASDLWGKFLFLLPEDMRQQYTCRACRKFVESYGDIVTLGEDGRIASVMWEPVPGPFFDALAYLRLSVDAARITGVFLTGEKVWGIPRNHDVTRDRDWHHMHVQPPAACIRPFSAVKTDGQAMAENREEYAMLQRGLTEFPVAIVQNAHTLLSTGQLFRSEKCEAVARWLLDLHEKRDGTKDTLVRDNITWLAVASAPAGWCHVRSGMIGTLLEDLSAGLSFEAVKRKWDEKMHPLQYLRPQAPPSAGNIAQAEKTVSALKTAGALDRRFARIEDLVLLWKPTPVDEPKPNGDGVFSHLKPKGRQSAHPSAVESPPVTMTWEKFARTVLPDAQTSEFQTPNHGNFIAMVTAANPDASPIVQWDREDRRNPVTHYVYSGGSFASRWNLVPGWTRVTGICLHPAQWHGDGLASQGEGVNIILEGARDTQYTVSGGMFPETMKSEYHGIRATIEAYFRSAAISGRDDATACGYGLSKGQEWSAVIRVTSRAGRVTYRLDRWD